LRLYTKGSLDRVIWKFQKSEGWKYSNYLVDEYLFNINDERLKEILAKRDNDDEKMLSYQIYNFELRKQYDKIPKIYKSNTHLFSRLDLDAITTIKANYERKDIANIKGYITADDALYGAMIWNFARVKYDEELLNLNADNNLLRIHYIVGAYRLANFGKQADLELLDCIKSVIAQ